MLAVKHFRASLSFALPVFTARPEGCPRDRPAKSEKTGWKYPPEYDKIILHYSVPMADRRGKRVECAMEIPDLKNRKALLYAVLAVIAAAVLRQIGFQADDPLDLFCCILRPSIYIGLFCVWGVSIRKRIIQHQVRRYLFAISALMVFWVTVRTIRFLFALDPWALRKL